jgi:hypothetical protein
MRASLLTAVNAVAWVIIVGLVGAAFAVTVMLGPFGLILLGLGTLFVCTSYNLHDQVPTRSEAVFRAQTESQSSPEQKAAMVSERQGAFAPMRFYRRCGVVLTVAGIAGFVSQQLQP